MGHLHPRNRTCDAFDRIKYSNLFDKRLLLRRPFYKIVDLRPPPYKQISGYATNFRKICHESIHFLVYLSHF